MASRGPRRRVCSEVSREHGEPPGGDRKPHRPLDPAGYHGAWGKDAVDASRLPDEVRAPPRRARRRAGPRGGVGGPPSHQPDDAHEGQGGSSGAARREDGQGSLLQQLNRWRRWELSAQAPRRRARHWDGPPSCAWSSTRRAKPNRVLHREAAAHPASEALTEAAPTNWVLLAMQPRRRRPLRPGNLGVCLPEGLFLGRVHSQAT